MPSYDHRVTNQQRIFIEGVLAGKSNTQAAADAGYKHPSMSGAKLMKNEHVASRIRNRRERAQKKTGITRDKLVKKYEEAIELAKERGKVSAMISGIAGLARLLGLDAPVKSEVTVKGEVDADIREARKRALLNLN